MNEFNKHQKNDKIKWAFTGIAFLLVFVMVTGLFLQLFGTGKQKPSEWFKKPGTEQTQPETPDNGEDKPAIDENGEELANGIIHEMPARMTFRTAKSLAAVAAAESSAYDSVTLNATVKPDSAADKTVDWSVAWVNASSEWATDKTVTDYVTVTPQSDGSTTATVQCLQPFGEQIRVTVVSRMNTNATASCTVDFAARPTSFIVGSAGAFALSFPPITIFNESGNIQNIEPMIANSSYLASGGKYNTQTTVSCSVQFKTAFTTGDVTINSFTIEGKPSSGLLTALKAQGLNSNDLYNELDINVPGKVEHMTTILLSYIHACGLSDSDGSQNVALVNKLNTAILNNTASDYDFDLRLTVNTNIGTYTFNNKYKVNRNASVFGVENVSLSNNNLVI